MYCFRAAKAVVGKKIRRAQKACEGSTPSARTIQTTFPSGNDHLGTLTQPRLIPDNGPAGHTSLAPGCSPSRLNHEMSTAELSFSHVSECGGRSLGHLQ